MKKSVLMLTALLCMGCNQKPKDFSTVAIGMTKQDVITAAGEPNKQNDIGETSIWTYPAADRTVVFRHDTVYSIITSAEARLDSINNSLQKADDDIARGLERIGNAFDSTATRLKRSMDTLRKK
ncbi:MAG TPA: hypothetical protein DIT07_05610 [Sphingobacteriaceae bacterium]|nr:hypothetical protein [Sphingobacteriaceae bacterium]